jgi:hypothetical protein
VYRLTRRAASLPGLRENMQLGSERRERNRAYWQYVEDLRIFDMFGQPVDAVD